jgi:hypothetical protein
VTRQPISLAFAIVFTDMTNNAVHFDDPGSVSSLHVAIIQTPAFYNLYIANSCLGHSVNLSMETTLKRKLNRTLRDYYEVESK